MGEIETCAGTSIHCRLRLRGEREGWRVKDSETEREREREGQREGDKHKERQADRQEERQQERKWDRTRTKQEEMMHTEKH